MPNKLNTNVCNVPASKFANKIISDEKQILHCNHRLHKIRPDLIDKSKVNLNALSTKFGYKAFYNEEFWTRILNNMFGVLDNNVPEIAEVGVVVKDKKKLSDVSGWRLIWKTKVVLKHYDAIRASCIRLDLIENSAYKAKSSTNTALSKLSCMHFDENQGLFGADFANAFALACRPCLNRILGVDYLPKCLYFDVKIGSSSSIEYQSVTGTGAGRPSGGPAFNVCLDTLFNEENADKNEMAIYADDSLIRCNYTPSDVNKILDVFKNGSHFGLNVHLNGKKSPTFMARQNSSLVNLPKEVRIVKSTAFLGLECGISANGHFVAQCTTKVLQRLHFLLYSLGTGLKLAYYGASIEEQTEIFKSASPSIAAMVESYPKSYCLC